MIQASKFTDGYTRKEISRDEAALINRGMISYYCAECLAEAFDVEPEDIRKKIEYYKQIGCTLFDNEKR